jgi:NTE family protein
MAYHFSNLVFEGGGVKGIAYVGALAVLESKDILGNITRVGGTSAGAITALLLGLKFSLSEINDVLSNLNFKKFLDDSFGVVRDTERLIKEFGWYKGDFFRKWASDLIEEKTGNGDATFGDIKTKGGFLDMYFMGTNLSTRFGEVFSVEHTPRVCVADAVRISMSIPLFFASKRSPRGDVYVDGGVLENYPVKLFDREKYVAPEHRRKTPYYDEHNAALVQSGRSISPYVFNKQTLGFRLDSAQEIAVFRDQAEPAHHEIDDFFSYAWALVETILEAQENRHLHSDDWQRTIYIDTLDVGTTDFDLDDEKKTALIQSGRDGCNKYFEWYDNPANTPVNR